MLLRQVAGTASFRPLGIVATRSSTPLRLSECSPQPARLTPLRGRRKRAAPYRNEALAVRNKLQIAMFFMTFPTYFYRIGDGRNREARRTVVAIWHISG